MPRKIRLEYPGAIYHVMSRGNQRQEIVRDDKDREIFFKTLAEACGKTGWQIHAYCLMRNHFHLVAETPEPNLVAGMKWFLGVYTKRFNIRHKTCGHLFAGRYKALPVSSGTGYLQRVCDYVHLNPARAKLLKRGQALESFKWSSYPHYLAEASQRPRWLRVDRLFGEKRIPRDSAAGRRQFGLRMAERVLQESEDEEDHLKQGAWYIGDEEFRKELLTAMEEKVGPNHYGSERRETSREKAERLIKAGLLELGLKESDLSKESKGEARKVQLAAELRAKTTLTLREIAQRLSMGSGGYVFNLLKRKGGGEKGE